MWCAPAWAQMSKYDQGYNSPTPDSDAFGIKDPLASLEFQRGADDADYDENQEYNAAMQAQDDYDRAIHPASDADQ